jgi:hypothetical protein
MPDGCWIAISLDNFAEAHLARGSGDEAVEYLYSTINHGTPLHTWCEERGIEPGTAKTSGDRQHLFTPAAVARFVRDALLMELDGGLHLALGASRGWLASGQTLGIGNAPSHFGPISYSMRYDPARQTVTGKIDFPEASELPWAVMHIRLPGGLRVRQVDPASGVIIIPGGEGIRWENPRGTIAFTYLVQEAEF